MLEPRRELRRSDVVLIVDVQNDFCPGGALPIADGDAVVPVLNRWISEARNNAVSVLASRDWHPRKHLSFIESGGQWPAHCVQDTNGAAFHPNLELGEDALIITKGTRFDKDQYSAFDETGLTRVLDSQGIRRIWIGGLAQDVCVRATALDGARAGFEVHLIPGGSRPVTPEGGQAALADMRQAGIVVY